MSHKLVLIEDDPDITDAIIDGHTTGKLVGHSVLDLPDLFTVDGYLPDITGIEICRMLIANPATNEIPIILFRQAGT